jgi:Transposase DDE domain/Domain of unknown function (DUF4372)
MNIGRSVFAQLLAIVPFNHFEHLVDKHQSNRWVRTFSAWSQFICLSYAQLTRRDGLRDLVACINALSHKLYHCGLRCAVAKSTLADANERRNFIVFEELANRLVGLAVHEYRAQSLPLGLSESLYALDSTTIDLCLKLFPWAHFRQTKAAVKAHTVLDLRGAIPVIISITTAKVHDVHALDDLHLPAGSILVVDRAYVDFARLYAWVGKGCHFVVRAKANMVFEVLSSVDLDAEKNDEISPSCEPLNTQTTLVSDQHIRLTGNKSKRSYPKTLRRVTLYDELGARELVFISNRLDLPALTIAAIYKQRWQIELFFKWLKQNLCVKHFFGNSENAVKSQIWIAVCVYLMVLIAHKRLNTKLSLRNFMHLIETHVFEKISLQALVDSATVNHKTTEMSAQENLF